MRTLKVKVLGAGSTETGVEEKLGRRLPAAQ